MNFMICWKLKLLFLIYQPSCLLIIVCNNFFSHNIKKPIGSDIVWRCTQVFQSQGRCRVCLLIVWKICYGILSHRVHPCTHVCIFPQLHVLINLYSDVILFMQNIDSLPFFTCTTSWHFPLLAIVTFFSATPLDTRGNCQCSTLEQGITPNS